MAEKTKYHNYEAVLSEVMDIQKKYPYIVKIEKIGQSHQKRDLLALKISGDPHKDKNPKVLFTSLIHGLEVIGLEVLLELVRRLTRGYGKDEHITFLVKKRESWFIPIINPDGFAQKKRKNAKGVDLNRNFSVGFSSRGILNKWNKWFFYPGPYPLSEPETKAVKKFIQRHDFALSLSLHSFTGLINYPYGHTKKNTKDHRLFLTIGKEMQKRLCGDYKLRKLSWFYRLGGSLEDELYERHNTLSFLLETSKGELSLIKPSTWFDPFEWFNPKKIKECAQNNIEAALYLLEIAGRADIRDR